MSKKKDETIYDADFTETPAEESDQNDEAENTESSLVIANTLKPLDPRRAGNNTPKLGIKLILIVAGVIVLLVLAALYLRGLQLATV